MKRLAMLAILILAGSPGAAKRADPHHPGWMVGEWVWLNPGEHYAPADCGADHNAIYHANGRYVFMDAAGRWRIDGDHLIETMTSAGGTGDPADIGKPRVMRIARLGVGRLRVRARSSGTMVRCPAR